MAKIKLPAYLSWRNGRPRWQPGPRLRDAGWKGRDLKDDAGAWLPLAKAIDAAEAINNEVEAWRHGGDVKRPKQPLPRAQVRTVEALYEKWIASPRFARLGETTQADYKYKAKPFLAEFGDKPLAAIEKHHLYQWWEELHVARGHAMANSVIAIARAMLSHAGRIGWRADNPARELGLDGVPPRVVIWTPTEVLRFVKEADRVGYHGLADAVVIALHTGQRLNDVLLFGKANTDHHRAMFWQSKTKARVAVPLTPQLTTRLKAIGRRRTAGPVVKLAEINEDGPLVRRPDGKPYDRFKLGKHFREVRGTIAEDLASIAEKHLQDLRDTAVTRLALAGCTVPEIRAITGHSLETVHAVLQHYLALDDAMAKAGIDRLKKWMSEEGIAL